MYQTTEYRATESPIELRSTCDIADIAGAFGVSIRTVANWTTREDFPKRAKINSRCHRWFIDEINAWAAKQQ